MFRIYSALLLSIWFGIAYADTTVNVSDTVLNASVTRIGVNLGSNNYYDSGEMG